ncbi:MAG: methyltransferase domain-containing protein [Gammaproteobacteria bacterium]|nr:methyltransferase domain-containing protein [Gammaproteobacteria bacterium]
MTSKDQNFDSHSKTFGKNIYGTIKGKIREAVLLRDLTDYLNNYRHDKTRPLTILDVGGGQGQVSLQLAKLGHQLVINDVSEQMLQQAKTNAEQQGLYNVEFIHCPLQSLPELLSEKQQAPFDLVLCHAVFEWLDDPQAAFTMLTELVKPNGAISLMFYNKVGQTLSNLVYGNFDYIDAGMAGKKVVKLNPQSSLNPEQVLSWIKEHQKEVLIKSGVRCFNDYMRDITMWQSKANEIIEKELTYSREYPYSDIGRYMHLLLV